MIFSSILFLYLFLPAILLLYYSVGHRFRNLVLLGASLLFYAWGEVGYVLLMLFSITINWLFGLWIEKTKARSKVCKLALGLGVILNLALLIFFKYANFLSDNINSILKLVSLGTIDLVPIHLPIGISFFTFQAISYIVDVYRNQAEVQRRPVDLALYIALFPQLIAGPIVRYSDVAQQIVHRTVSLEDFRYGIQRFVVGLGKKILIANTVGAVADQVFSLPSGTLPASLLWLGMLTYTLQIYYDFSGYSDMAIGLGRMFGFHFLENFNYPYSATSVQDFWRRWHISLSSWFRDYLYVPLGGNRKGTARTYGNLLIVFFLCGLWHGASWTFIVWGLFHGFFLALERWQLAKILKNLPSVVTHIYTIMVFMVGWVFFRAESLPKALNFLLGLCRFDVPPYLNAQLFAALNMQFYIAIVAGMLFAFPLMPLIVKQFCQTKSGVGSAMQYLQTALKTLVPMIWMVMIIIYSSAQLISGTHNPFLYFRF
jgi:alginate O-acetyltransferase complex protein AlgI